MPINKNALLRYQILDRCFSDRHRRYEIEDLVDKVNEALLDMYGKTVSLRQIRADITYMHDRVSYNAPIVARTIEGRRCYYTYEDPRFSIFCNELSVEEVKNLLSTIDMLGRYRSPKNAWLEEVISSLELRFGIKANREKVVSFEQNEQLKGIEFLSDLIDATLNHQPLLMTYRPYKGEEQTMVFHPHYLKQYNTRWFIIDIEDPYETAEGGEDVIIQTTYKQRVIEYLAQGTDNPTFRKIQDFEQLTSADFEELERVFFEELGSKDDFEELADGHPYKNNVAAFIRVINGIDRKKALQIYQNFIEDNNLTSEQELYLKNILDYVSVNGDIEIRNFMEYLLKALNWRVTFGDNFVKLKDFVKQIHQVILATA